MDALDVAIERAGGVSLIARRLGLAQSAVSNWRSRGGLVPAQYCAALEGLCSQAVRRWQFRPHDWHLIWPELIGTDGAPPVPQTTEEIRDAA